MFHFSHIFYQNLTDLQKEEIKVLQALWETFYQVFFIEFEENSNIFINNLLFRDEEGELVFYAKEISIKGIKTLSVIWHPKVEGELSYFFSSIKSTLEEKTCFCLDNSFPSFFFHELKREGFQEFLREEVFIFSSKLKLVRDKEDIIFYEEVTQKSILLDALKEEIKIGTLEYIDRDGVNFSFNFELNSLKILSQEDKVHIFSKALSIIRGNGFEKDVSLILDQDTSFSDILLDSGFRKTKNLSLWRLS